MARLSIEQLEYTLRHHSMNVELMPSIIIGFGVHKVNYAVSNQSTYGEWILYNNKYEPAFYFHYLKDDGERDEIFSYAQKKGLDVENLLITLLAKKGYFAKARPQGLLIKLKSEPIVTSIPLIRIAGIKKE